MPDIIMGDRRMGVILSMDFGSTFTRALLHAKKGELLQGQHTMPIRLSDKAAHLQFQSHPDVYVFPSYGKPLEAEGEWQKSIGVYAWCGYNRCSLKYYPYFLVGESDEELDNYPHFKLLREHKDEVGFIEKLHKSLVIFFADIAKQVVVTCDHLGCFIEEVVLTIPPQWCDDKFEKLYVQLMLEGFATVMSEKSSASATLSSITPDEVSFITEGEALAHFLFTKEPATLKRAEVVLVIDFGGHCMNGCTFAVRWLPSIHAGAQEMPAFFEVQDPFSAPGGSELWTHLFGEFAKRRMDAVQAFDETEWKLVLETFTRQKRFLGPQYNEPVSYRVGDSTGRIWTLVPGQDELAKQHREAFHECRVLAKSMIDAANERYGAERLCIVFSGGSLLNDPLREIVGSYAESKAATVLWTCEFPGSSSKFMAEGAGMSVANRSSVEDFMKNGAAFAIQTGNLKGQWENHVPPLYRQPDIGEAQQSTYPKPNTDFLLRIVCNPFFGAASGNLHFNDCYIVHDLGMRRRAVQGGSCDYSWTIGMSKLKSEERAAADEIDCLVLIEKQYRHVSGQTVVNTIKLPLYFSSASNCVLTYEDDRFSIQSSTDQMPNEDIEQGAGHNRKKRSRARGKIPKRYIVLSSDSDDSEEVKERKPNKKGPASKTAPKKKGIAYRISPKKKERAVSSDPDDDS